jgi:hypothetical protein
MTEAEWLVNSDSLEMLSLLESSGRPSERKARLFVAAVCRRIWDLLEDGRSRGAVEVAERFADGLACARELEAAHAAAGARNRELVAWEPLEEAASVAVDVCCPTAADVAFKAAMNARQARSAVEQPDFSHCLWTGEEEAQCALLRCLFGNPFRPVALVRAWLTPSVTTLANAAYQERALPSGPLDPHRLAVLADALEEAGCADADILGHLRGRHLHVRGCWALDLVLGRS